MSYEETKRLKERNANLISSLKLSDEIKDKLRFRILELKKENDSLKAALTLHNRPDIRTRPSHDEALQGIFQELQEIR